ncbi:hypothetical protein P378_00240 [Desulforamulus profundi]|uniref:Uncharacterized protein n=1 Tax=Desulforamulus profundi TaxID=1383067 RepID=A0A2C6MJG0_9FIRM|nr:hypothetical protein P378_00240 [Desulforamulus profundi]
MKKTIKEDCCKVRKASIWLLVMLFLFSLYSPAYASYAKSGLTTSRQQ